MKKYILFQLFVFSSFYVFAQNNDSSKTALKKKYENSSINEELTKKISTTNKYPDSIVLAPLHFVNTFITLDTAKVNLESFSVDVEIKNEVPDWYSLYISPFNGNFNDMMFYGGIQTHSGGKPINGTKDEEIGRGGIFSRWMERDKNALKTKGYYASSDGEGDFISVRNKLKWNKGKYRLRLYKSGYVPGKPIPEKFTSKDLMFAWGDYEHSWITYEVEDLQTHQKTEIGSLAFPGKNISFNMHDVIFLEQYGSIINFASINKLPYALDYKKLPVINLTIGNFQINGKKIIPMDVKTFHNRTHHPDQKSIKMPIPLLSTATYNKTNGSIDYEIGAFQSWNNPAK